MERANRRLTILYCRCWVNLNKHPAKINNETWRFSQPRWLRTLSNRDDVEHRPCLSSLRWGIAWAPSHVISSYDLYLLFMRNMECCLLYCLLPDCRPYMLLLMQTLLGTNLHLLHPFPINILSTLKVSNPILNSTITNCYFITAFIPQSSSSALWCRPSGLFRSRINSGTTNPWTSDRLLNRWLVHWFKASTYTEQQTGFVPAIPGRSPWWWRQQAPLKRR
jgi:hypothetical protein